MQDLYLVTLPPSESDPDVGRKAEQLVEDRLAIGFTWSSPTMGASAMARRVVASTTEFSLPGGH